MANSSIYAAFERMWQHVVAKVGAKADIAHNHDDNYDEKGAAAAALISAQSYANSAANAVKDDLLNGAGAAYDTLKELGDLIDENVDAIEALELVATNKMDKENPAGTGSFSMNQKEGSIIGENSVTFGTGNEASGDNSAAIGVNNTASGSYSFAIGNGTTAEGWTSYAEGIDTKATADGAHAEGQSTLASGDISHAEGYNTIAASSSQHVEGEYNIADSDNVYIHIVGNGDDENRSNAHTLDWDGNAWYSGDVYVGSTSGSNKDEGSKKLATEEYVDIAMSNAGGTTPDWNQNDETASDYIKNRTHWKGTAPLVAIEHHLDSPIMYMDLGNTTEVIVYPNAQFRITINSNVYEMTMQAIPNATDAALYLGNPMLVPASGLSDNGEPFGIRIKPLDTVGCNWIIWSDISINNIKIEALGQTQLAYHQLDENYIPDSIARKNYVDNSLKVEEVASSITSKNWFKVCYGNGKFVAIATSGEIAYSENGVNWTQANLPNLPATGIWRGIAYGNGRFVVASYNSAIAMYSVDGINWTASALPISEQWTDMTFGNGKFVVISSNSANEDSVASSTDGINWTLSDLPTIYMETVTYGDGKFVAISYNQNMSACSIDGINWTASAMPVSGSWSDVEYGNGKFVAVVKSGSAAAYSVDGINWTASALPSSQDWVSIGYGNGIFTTVVNSGTIGAYSVDGITWISTTWTIDAQWKDICYGNGKFVAIAKQSAIVGLSNNGIEWGKYNRELQNLDGSDRTIAIKHALGINDYNTQVYDIKTQVDSLKSSIFTDTTSGNKVVMFTPLCSNTEYRYVSADGITSLTFNSDASDTFLNTTEAYYFIVFKSGTTATSIINTISINFTGNDCSDGTFAPLSSKTYEIGIWWNGISWQGIVRAA